ncbi:MAG: hypothetical protein WCW87_04310 [Candidatus Paceibacterota bacterium]
MSDLEKNSGADKYIGYETEDSGEISKQTSREEAFSTIGFADFLARYEDAESATKDSDKVRERFAIFESQKKVAEGLQVLYRGDIKERGGVELSHGELEFIKKSILEKAIRSPEDLRIISEQLENYQKNNEAIARLEEEVGGLYDEEKVADTIEKKKEKLYQLKMSYGSFLWIRSCFSRSAREDLKARRSTEERIEELESIVDQVKDLENVADQIMDLEIADLETNKKEAASIRKELVGDVESIKLLDDLAKKNVKEQLADFMYRRNGEPTNLQKLEEAQAFFEKLQEIDATRSDNPYLKDVNIEIYQNHLNTLIEAAVQTEIKKAIESIRRRGVTLSDIEEKLEPFISKNKLGTKEGDEARQFIIKAITEVASGLDPKDSKRMLISYIIERLNS